MLKALKAAFPYTIPIMLGYLSIGIAFGLLFQAAGFHFIWALLTSIIVYAGAMQFIAINILTSGLGLVQTALMTLLINIRHMFYGLSFLDTFNRMGKKKWYMIYSLSDETYSLLCSLKPPQDVDPNLFRFSVSLLNQCYWIVGSVLGGLVGSLITFNTAGMDFAMTALFIVIFIEQWKSYSTHLPALIGLGATFVTLLVFGPDNVALPAMLLIIALLLAGRPIIEHKLATEEAIADNAGTCQQEEDILQ